MSTTECAKLRQGPTRCVSGTVCTYVDENSYFCLQDPASTRTTPSTTTTASAAPTIGLPYDRCGGSGWTGPTTCKDSVCIRIDECKTPNSFGIHFLWHTLTRVGYSQCQPAAAPQKSSTAPPQNTPKPSSTDVPGNWPSTRTRRTFPGSSNPAPTQVQSSTGRQTTTSKPPPPAPAPTGPVQLYDQCGGLTWTVSTDIDERSLSRFC